LDEDEVTKGEDEDDECFFFLAAEDEREDEVTKGEEE
jgi:hypothetical protein